MTLYVVSDNEMLAVPHPPKDEADRGKWRKEMDSLCFYALIHETIRKQMSRLVTAFDRFYR